MSNKLDILLQDFNTNLNKINSLQELDELKTTFLGKKGRLTDILKTLRDLPPAQKAEIGKNSNICKKEIEEKLNQFRNKLETNKVNESLADEWLDYSLNESSSKRGGLHPVSIVQYELEDLFTSMGFTILDGPHIETEYYNFEALNIPADHPARDMQDTFYFENGAILRTHTSPIQIRGMENIKPPFKILGPGKVFRVERPDASHDAAFHQLEGMVVAEGINVAHLNQCMQTMLTEIFKKDVKVRLRPGYFPFVEPGFELDMSCLLCNGKGCSVCNKTGWVETLGCGLIHPNVLKAGGIDPEKYSGFAFGLGVDRLVMMRYQIEDIRHLHSSDLRFSSQFI